MASKTAGSLAAASRLGGTSLDAIDSEISMTSMTTARFSGIRTSEVGPAMAVVSSTNDAASRIVGTCRHRLGRAFDHHRESAGFGNGGAVETVPVQRHGEAQSLELQLPPLATVYLRLDN